MKKSLVLIASAVTFFLVTLLPSTGSAGGVRVYVGPGYGYDYPDTATAIRDTATAIPDITTAIAIHGDTRFTARQSDTLDPAPDATGVVGNSVWLNRAEVRRIAVNVARLPELLGRNERPLS
jgi:hypothetical protein